MARVLLVDDHPDVREVVGQLLQMHGHEVAFVNTGEEAIVDLGRQHPDVLVTDHRLPGLTGVELLQHVAADPGCSNIYRVLFSADAYVRDLAMSAKADAYWVKGSDGLFECIAQLEHTRQQFKRDGQRA